MSEKIYKDYVPPTSGKKYRLTPNPDGTTNIADETTYLQTGDDFGALQANGMLQKAGGKMVGSINFTRGNTGNMWGTEEGSRFYLRTDTEGKKLELMAGKGLGLITNCLCVSDEGICDINGSATYLQHHSLAVGEEASSDDPRDKVLCCGASGAVEIGNVLDFHSTYAPNESYAVRLLATPNALAVKGALNVGGHIKTDNDLVLLAGKSLILADNVGQGTSTISQNSDGLDYRTQGSHVHRFLNSSNIWAEVQARGFSQQSSRRFKENIVDMTDAQARQLLRIGIKQFDYIDGAKAQFGAIAEEVVEIQPQSVYLDAQGLPNAIGYAEYTPQLIKLCQIQQVQMDALRAQIDALTARLDALAI